MKIRFILLIVFAFLFQTLSAQSSYIKSCDLTLCKVFELKEAKIKPIKQIKEHESMQCFYEKNHKNFIKDSISFNTLITAINEIGNIDTIQFKKMDKNAQKELTKLIIQQESWIFKRVRHLIDTLDLKNGLADENELRRRLEYLNTYHSISYIYAEFDKFVVQQEKTSNSNRSYIYGLKRNQKALVDRMNYIFERDYIHYRNPIFSKKIMKEITFFHDNDVFMIPLSANIRNEDKYYTGGGRLEMKTDFLKMRFLLNIFPEVRKRVLSYQGVFAGIAAYTPYIRYKDIAMADRIANYEKDRPFGSYEYFGRSKYRMHYRGLWRWKSQFSIGIIGGKKGSIAQSIIHRDQAWKSVKVIGWDRQIANGGRFAMNIDHKIDLMLFSKERALFNKANRWDNKPAKGNDYINVSSTLGLHVGNYLTAIDFGLGFSTLNFIEQNGDNNYRLKNGKLFRWKVYVNAYGRWVIHNSMLEGFGLFNTYPDDPYDDEPISVYQLERDQVVPLVYYLEVGASMRMNKTTLFLKWVYNTKEFERAINSCPLGEEKACNIYGWGTVGAAFNL